MSTLKVTNIQATGEIASRAVSGVAAVWVQVTKSTDTINNSFNVSSLTDLGAGQSRVTFTNNMVDGSGAAVATNRSVSTGLGVFASPASSGDTCAVYTRDTSAVLTDYNFSSSIHGDLA